MKKFITLFMAAFIISSTPVMAMPEHEREARILFINQVLNKLKMNEVEVNKSLPGNMNGYFLSRYALLMQPLSGDDIQNDFNYMLDWLKQQVFKAANFNIHIILSDLVSQGQKLDQSFRAVAELEYETIPVVPRQVNAFSNLRLVPFEPAAEPSVQPWVEPELESACQLIENPHKEKDDFSNIRLGDETPNLVNSSEY